MDDESVSVLLNHKKICDCLEDGGGVNSKNSNSGLTTEESLKALSDASGNKALELANELLQSLNDKNGNGSDVKKGRQNNNNNSTMDVIQSSSSSSCTEGYLLAEHVPPCVLEAARKHAVRSSSHVVKKKLYYGSGVGDIMSVVGDSSEEDRLEASLACCESIVNSLSKVASGGSQASLELRALEDKRRETDLMADDIAAALRLRSLASNGAEALGARRYADASRAIQEYKQVQGSDRALRIAGDPTRRGYERTRTVLQRAILERYRTAVTDSDLTALSELTPLLSMLDLANEGVGLYLRYSQGALESVMTKGLEQDQSDEQEQLLAQQEQDAGVKVSRAEQKRRQERQVVTVCTKLAKIYNAAVTHLRHHLPMVAYALGDADGDAALVQLVHLQVEKLAVDIIKDYTTDHRLHRQEMNAEQVCASIEERYSNSNLNSNSDDDDDFFDGFEDDCGFQEHFFTVHHVDSSLEEAALLLQHTESYERFIRHAVNEVNKARHLRAEQKQQEELQQQKQIDQDSKQQPPTAQPQQQRLADILPKHTQLNESISEFGNYYTLLERTLLLASLQRAVQHQTRHANAQSSYAPLSIVSNTIALQSALVEEAFYVAQRSSLRAFATGHAATATAAANLCSDTIGRVLYDILIRRAHHTTTILIKPGEGLLALTNTSAAAIHTAAKTTITNIMQYNKQNPHYQQQEQPNNKLKEIAYASATINDLLVAAEFSKRLQTKLLQDVDQTYSKNQNDPIKKAIKTLSQVQQSFISASFRATDQLVATLLPRIRTIIHDAIGQEPTTGFSLTGAATSQTPKLNSINMNYDLNDHDYEMAQITQGYINRLCSSLEQTFRIFSPYLAPKISDHLLIGIIAAACKRIEVSIKRCQFSTLGALALDSDVRFFINFVKERLDDTKYTSNVELYKACNPLARLAQIALLMNVDDLEDVLDLISSCKRKGRWDLKLEDAKAFLNLRKDFEATKVNELLHIPDDK